jgi:cell division transport system ATP-binding protein
MITFKDVSKIYGNETTVLEGINFTLEKGSFSFLIGPTGSGKTTIFRLLIRDLLPTTGEITLGELDLINLPKKNIPHLRRKVGVIFQDLKLLMDRTVTENVTLPLELAGVKAEEALQKAESILEEVGLGSKKDRFPVQLSGGEKQRVAIARALIFDPEVILADEPTGNLDNQTSFQIVSLLESINKKGTTIFMATHNDKIVEKENSKRILIMEKGKIINEKNPKKENVKEEKAVEEKK